MPGAVAEGWLRKKGQLNQWRQRYFVLQEEAGTARLLYFRSDHDQEPRGSFELTPNCAVSGLKKGSTGSKQHYAFTITFAADRSRESETQAATQSGQGASRRTRMGKGKKAAGAVAGAGLIVITGGIAGAIAAGIALTAVGVGAAAGVIRERQTPPLIIGHVSAETAEWWRLIIRRALSKTARQNPSPSRSLQQIHHKPAWACLKAAITGWTAHSIQDGLCVMEAADNHTPDRPCLKVTTVVRTSPACAFELIMDINNLALLETGRVVQRIDQHTDIIHVLLKPQWLWPCWTSKRDVCLLRQWKAEKNGSYEVSFKSTTHPACPPTSNFVRAVVYGEAVPSSN